MVHLLLQEPFLPMLHILEREQQESISALPAGSTQRLQTGRLGQNLAEKQHKKPTQIQNETHSAWCVHAFFNFHTASRVPLVEQHFLSRAGCNTVSMVPNVRHETGPSLASVSS